MMLTLTENDALRIAKEYYGKAFTQEDAVRIVATLANFTIKATGFELAGLIQYAYEYAYDRGVLDERAGSRNDPMRSV